MSESQKTLSEESTTIDSAKPLGQEYQPRDMTKTEAGFILVLLAGVVSAVGLGIRADIKNQQKYAEQLRVEREERDARAESVRKARSAWFDDQRKGGKTVLELRDGTYIAISNEAYSKAEIKKKGQWL